LDAAEIVREAAKEVNGGGGGRKDMAQAGGGSPEGLEKALERAREVIEERLAGRGGD
jgi:alanyl-tRNA synthetase